MLRKIYLPLTTVFLLICVASCDKDVKEFTYLQFALQFDETQERLNNLGEPSTLPPGNAAITPVMHSMSVHYIELVPDAYTLYKEGQIIYKAPETMDGGQLSIDFDSSLITDENTSFYKVNINKIAPGTYQYVRASLAYQNYDVQFNILNIPTVGDLLNQTGTVASFVGYRTYIRQLSVNQLSTDIYADKDQGFWAFETLLSEPYNAYNAIYTGQAPAGATTVVNPLHDTAPIPPGSCVVTGKFAEPLVITGDESDDAIQEDLVITLSFSTNQSFEWVDLNANSAWDIDAADASLTEQIVDMGVRGLIPIWEWKEQ
jgi:hypothetical protein